MNSNLEQILTALMKEIDSLVEERVNLKIAELKKGYAKKQQPLMNVQEAASYLNLSVKTVYRYVQLGKLSYFKPAQLNCKNGNVSGKNTKIFFKQTELNRYLLNEENHYYSEDELDMQAQTKLVKSKFF